MYVYALALENDKFYVGLCLKGDPFKRIKNHYKANGARYTQNNRVLQLIHLEEIHDTLQELISTLQFMRKYGVNNVRGDKYVQKFIDDFEREEISNLLINLDVPCVMILGKSNKIIIRDDVEFDPRQHKLEICFPACVQKIIVVLRCIETFGLRVVENDIYGGSDMKSTCIHLRHSNQQCIICGACDHFAKSCHLDKFELDESFHSDKSAICEQSVLRFCRTVSAHISFRSTI